MSTTKSRAIATTGIVVVLTGAFTALDSTGRGDPRDAPRGSPAMTLTASGDGIQPALDDLLTAMNQAAADDAALPFATPDSSGMLMTDLQNTNYELLMAGISRVTELFNGWFFQSPEVTAGDASDSRQFFQFFTPDIYYHETSGLAPGATYELTGTLGGGTEFFAVAADAVNGSQAVTKGSLELGDNLVVNPNGTFTVFVGPTEPAGAVNFLNDTDATSSGFASLLVRGGLGDWAKGPASISIHCVSDCPPFAAIPSGGLLPGGGDTGTDADADAGAGANADGTGAVDTIAASLTGADSGSSGSLLTTLLSAFAQIVPSFNAENMGLAQVAGIGLPANTMGALTPETDLFDTGLPSADVSAGNFDLQPDQALIIKVPDVPSAFSSVELMNVFGAGLPGVMSQTTLNNTTAFHDADGYTYYVVSATNPGVANWLDSSDVSKGEIFARFEGLPSGTDPTGTAVSTQVVPVADVAQYLPADTPTVSPEQYAADMLQRVLSYDYGLDSSRMNAQPDWLIQELLLHGLKNLMGADDFAKVFGSEPETPLDLRMTPALSPDWTVIEQDFTEHPTTTLTAVFDNLPLLWSDISQPIELALPDLIVALVTGGDVGTAFTDAFTDPTYGIFAGFLNARDDLATAIMTADDDFPTELGQQATQQWTDMPDLLSGS